MDDNRVRRLRWSVRDRATRRSNALTTSPTGLVVVLVLWMPLGLVADRVLGTRRVELDRPVGMTLFALAELRPRWRTAAVFVRELGRDR